VRQQETGDAHTSFENSREPRLESAGQIAFDTHGCSIVSYQSKITTFLSQSIIMPPLKEQVPQAVVQIDAEVVSATAMTVSSLTERKRRRLSSDTDSSIITKSSSDSTMTSPRHVRFASDSLNHEIADTGRLTEQEMNAMFMTHEDQKRIFIEISQTLAKATASAAKNGKRKRNICDTIIDLEASGNEGIRGLECIVQKRNSNRGKRMKAAVNAVMNRQAHHEIDEAWIVNDYRPLLEESKRLARERGLKDEIAGRCVFRTTKNPKKQGKQQLRQGKVNTPTSKSVSK
jgi:hypothetical protein